MHQQKWNETKEEKSFSSNRDFKYLVKISNHFVSVSNSFQHSKQSNKFHQFVESIQLSQSDQLSIILAPWNQIEGDYWNQINNEPSFEIITSYWSSFINQYELLIIVSWEKVYNNVNQKQEINHWVNDNPCCFFILSKSNSIRSDKENQ